MTIDQKMVTAVQCIVEKFGVGHVVTRAELIALLRDEYQVTPGSTIPSDYCYNRINDGIALSKPTLFEFLGRGQYRCLGEDYPYDGVIYHMDQVVGHCQKGIREIYGISDSRTAKSNEENKAQKSRDPSPRLRFNVLARDKFTCRFCGASPTKDPSVTLHIDHIIPWSKAEKLLLIIFKFCVLHAISERAI